MYHVDINIEEREKYRAAVRASKMTVRKRNEQHHYLEKHIRSVVHREPVL